jgi:hypothetical protein
MTALFTAALRDFNNSAGEGITAPAVQPSRPGAMTHRAATASSRERRERRRDSRLSTMP